MDNRLKRQPVLLIISVLLIAVLVFANPDRTEASGNLASPAFLKGTTVELVKEFLPALEAHMDEQVLADARKITDDDTSRDLAITLANLLLIQRHPMASTWFFAQHTLRHPQDANALNNLGAMLLEVAALPQSKKNARRWTRTAVTLLARARDLSPNSAKLRGNLGYGLFELWLINQKDELLAAAIDELRAAVQLEAGNPVLHAHLAEVLMAKGQRLSARKSLNDAIRLNRNHPAITRLTGKWNYQTTLGTPANCMVNYRCEQVCPPGIAGTLKQVQCLMEETSARIACNEGRPFAKKFDCFIGFPDCGILIPGLNAGLTVIAPWGRGDVKLAGDGRVIFRFNLFPPIGKGLTGAISVSGSWDPKNGIIINRTSGGAAVNVAAYSKLGKELTRACRFPFSLSVEHVSKPGEKPKIDINLGFADLLR